MIPLEKQLRSKLENTIKEARDIAEAGALAALQQLGVGLKEADAHLSEAEKDLRRRLRAHGRQLGDLRKADGTQELICLKEEVAYEHWHRMLFARFLAENDLLMYPDPDEPVAVSLEECEEMAADEEARNGWELAARYASKMLPQIFRPDSPSFKLELPPEYQRKLENLLAELAVEAFQASDALGWVYQFWQAKRKDEVNASEVKIGARELPAVTQLFTEPYMVSFLLDNSLGAWWAARRLTPKDYEEVSTEYTESTDIERELRKRASLPGVPLEYLRFVNVESTKDTKGTNKEDETNASNVRDFGAFRGQSSSVDWTPAAGTFDGWPEQLAELKTLDPCCGSGHFLVAAFLMLVPMRMEREGLSAREAVDAVLRENLHGLEIDPRCVEIAAFALALTAWRFPKAGGYRPLPELQLACSGLSISVAKEEWKQLAELASDSLEGKRQADLFGDEESGLWKIRLTGAMDQLYSLFSQAPTLGSLLNPNQFERELFHADFDEGFSLFRVIADEARTVEQKEIGVVALGLVKAAELLSKQYALLTTNVPYLSQGKLDPILLNFSTKNFPDSKADLSTIFISRMLKMLTGAGCIAAVTPHNWHYLASYKKMRKRILKDHSFLFSISLGYKAFSSALWDFGIALNLISKPTPGVKSNTRILGLNPNAEHKEIPGLISSGAPIARKQTQLAEAKDQKIMASGSNLESLEEHCYTYKGICSGDTERFIFSYWEAEVPSKVWSFMQGSFSKSTEYDGRSFIFRWENGTGEFMDYATERLGDNISAWIRGGGAWRCKGVTVRIMGYLPCVLYTGEKYNNNVATIIPKNVDVLPALWVYCSSSEYNKEVRRINQKPSITDNSFLQVPFDLEHWKKVAEERYPNGLPKPYSDDPTQWIFHGHPVSSDDPLQVAVARLLGYRWPAELDAQMELSDEAIAKVAESEKLLPFADEDGIVCIPPVRGEASAADRLLNLLASAYGDAWSNATLSKLLTDAEQKDQSLDGWLRDRFFLQHCKRFQHRPFIWHIWDGLRDGFAALVNYHKFDAKALETLIYTYLGDWISRQQQDIRNSVDGAQEKLAAAENLKQRLEAIRQGEAPYDIFVRWKPLEQQPIGWNPDLNDGVRLNIRPFLTGPDLKKRGAGILREKPNIHWKKDRGKDVESAPWYPVFQGERINDHHLSRAEKEAARKEKA
jgi:hypothetical protein